MKLVPTALTAIAMALVQPGGRPTDDAALSNQARPTRRLIIVAAAQYHAALKPWLEHRRGQGFDMRIVDPAVLLKDHPGADAVTILRDEIARNVELVSPETELTGVPAAYVLLVGDAPGPTEPLDINRLIPGSIQISKSYPSARRRFISDNIFALPREQGEPQLAVGRWPVRTASEVAIQVQKAIAFERATPNPARRDVTLIATTPNYDPFFDPLLERMAMGLINGQLKQHWGLRAIYASPRSDYFPGPEETQRQVVRWLEEPTPFTLFAGHGYDCGVDFVRYEGRQYPVLDSNIAETVHGSKPGTILWMSACSCGDFDLPASHRGLAEALMMNPNGPTAVVAGTDETSAYSNLLLCIGLAHDVLENPPDTLGEALLRFKSAAYKPGPALLKNLLLAMEPVENPAALAEDHQYLYNLLGDPSLAIHLPRRIGFTADVAERVNADSEQRTFSVSGHCDDVSDGTAWVSLTIDRLQQKEPSNESPARVAGSDRRAAYLERFLAANDKIAAAATARVTGGRFELDLAIDAKLVSRVRWLQLYVQSDATGESAVGEGIAVQAVRLTDDLDH